MVSGGDVPDRPGFYLTPAVVADVDNDMRIAREEIFGPVASVIPFDDEDDAIRIANDSDYGLSGSLWTGATTAGPSGSAKALRTGVLSVNTNRRVRFEAPFGGYKRSGLGRELGMAAMDHYTEVKNVFFSGRRRSDRAVGRRQSGKVGSVESAGGQPGSSWARNSAQRSCSSCSPMRPAASWQAVQRPQEARGSPRGPSGRSRSPASRWPAAGRGPGGSRPGTRRRPRRRRGRAGRAGPSRRGSAASGPPTADTRPAGRPSGPARARGQRGQRSRPARDRAPSRAARTT